MRQAVLIAKAQWNGYFHKYTGRQTRLEHPHFRRKQNQQYTVVVLLAAVMR